MRFSFHPEAEREFNEAIEYYEHADPGLGIKFVIEINSTIQNILSYPRAWPTVSKNAQRCLVNRFPYGLLYHVDQEEIIILAVMHLHRHPDYWKKRK